MKFILLTAVFICSSGVHAQMDSEAPVTPSQFEGIDFTLPPPPRDCWASGFYCQVDNQCCSQQCDVVTRKCR